MLGLLSDLLTNVWTPVVGADAPGLVAQALLCGTLASAALLRRLLDQPRTHWPRALLVRAYTQLLLCTIGVVYPWVWLLVGREPVGWVLSSLAQHRDCGPRVAPLPVRALLAIFWVGMIALGVRFAPDDDGRVQHDRKVKFQGARLPVIVQRKYYHLLAVAMFLPAILVEPDFVRLSMAVAFAFFVVAELLRAPRLPPLGPALQRFMERYLDARDAGKVVLTHTYLLVGIALPVWVHHAKHLPSEWFLEKHVPALAGLLMLGVGDTAASFVGVKYGRVRWPQSTKTLEGSLGAVVCVMFALALSFAGFVLVRHCLGLEALLCAGDTRKRLFSVFWATVAAATIEATTVQIDNLFLPPYYFVCLTLAIS